MSYLEGDSLLKEIERSLENHSKEEEEEAKRHKQLLSYEVEDDEEDEDEEVEVREMIIPSNSQQKDHLNKRQVISGQSVILDEHNLDPEPEKRFRILNQEQL